MAIPPLGASPPPPPRNIRKSSLENDNSAKRIADSERETAEKIKASSDRVSEAQRQSAQAIEQVRDEYTRQTETEAARNEALVEHVRSKGYERIRDLLRAQDQEVRRIKREGEKELGEVSDYYRNTINRIRKTNESDLFQLQNQNQRNLEAERNNSQLEMNGLVEDRDAQIERIRHSTREETTKLLDDHKHRYDVTRQEFETAEEKNRMDFLDNFEHKNSEYQQIIDRLNERASTQIDDIRLNSASKLAAYSSRQNDPFYQLIELNGQLSDQGEYFELTLNVPEHEKKNFRASVRGENLVVTGFRTNQEEVSTEDGHKVGTSAYQAFHESFPLSWPVDSKRLSREDVPGQIIFRIPKKGPYEYRNKVDIPADKLRQSRPQFPKNVVAVDAPQKGETVKAKPGSGTIL